MAPVVVGDVTVVLPYAGHPPDTPSNPIRIGTKTLSVCFTLTAWEMAMKTSHQRGIAKIRKPKEVFIYY